MTPRGSFNCPIKCAYDVAITDAPYAGLVASLCGGGENTEGAAGVIGILDPATALAMTDHYDALGLESSTFGCVLGMAFEAYNNLHDWRPFWSFLFGQFIASAGPTHQAQGADLYADPELGVQERMKSPADSLDEALAKIPYVRRSQVKKLWEDCLGVCWFACWGVQDVIRLSSEALGQAVGWDDFTPEEALAVGDRVVNLMRLVYARRGFTKADEFDISPRLLEGPPGGRAEGRTLAPFLADMVDEYYRQMGWDVETGLPPPDLLKRLRIEEFA